MNLIASLLNRQVYTVLAVFVLLLCGSNAHPSITTSVRLGTSTARSNWDSASTCATTPSSDQSSSLWSMLKSTFHSSGGGSQSPFLFEFLHPEEEPTFAVDLSQYEDEQVIRFEIANDKERQDFVRATETLVLDLWAVEDGYAHVRINKRRVRDLLRLLPKGMRQPSRRQVYVEDVQRSVLASIPLSYYGKNFFDEYRDFDEMNKFFKSMLKRNVSVESIASTAEGNNISALTIGHGPIDVVVTSGLHAREWLAISSSLYALEQLLNDDQILSLATIKFVPIANPDGYVYSWATDRLWRKNRQQTGVSMCSGMDLHGSLNYNDNDKTDQAVTACSESFAGKEELQAVEAREISQLVKKTDVYIDLSSYTQQLVGKHCDEALSRKVRKQTGRDYQVVSNHSGAYEAPKVASYQVRLPDVDGTGFLSHKRHIEPMGREVTEILKLVIGEQMYVG